MADVGNNFAVKKQLNPDTTAGYMMVPRFIVYLCVAKSGKTPQKCVEEAQHYIEYYVKYHLNAFSRMSDMQLHPAYEVIHNCGSEAHMTQNDGELLGAVNLLIDVIQASISNILDERNKDITQRTKLFRKCLDSLCYTFVTISTLAPGRDNVDWIRQLGKYSQNPYRYFFCCSEIISHPPMLT